MIKSIRNTTGSNIVLEGDDDPGIELPAGFTYLIDRLNYDLWSQSTFPGSPVYTLVMSGDLVVNDGIKDITLLDEAVDYLQYSNFANSVRLIQNDCIEEDTVQKELERQCTNIVTLQDTQLVISEDLCFLITCDACLISWGC